ncbi:Uncharacterised protein [Candidatus Tiddalikarchaeum anstoanum]|nr:Uncharacterised protein [Candidatus Tiddalikarchaeum anstoanum]
MGGSKGKNKAKDENPEEGIKKNVKVEKVNLNE